MDTLPWVTLRVVLEKPLLTVDESHRFSRVVKQVYFWIPTHIRLIKLHRRRLLSFDNYQYQLLVELVYHEIESKKLAVMPDNTVQYWLGEKTRRLFGFQLNLGSLPEPKHAEAIKAMTEVVEDLSSGTKEKARLDGYRAILNTFSCDREEIAEIIVHTPAVTQWSLW